MAFDETYDEPEYTEVLVKSLDPGHPVELRYAHAGDAGADLVRVGVVEYVECEGVAFCQLIQASE